MTRRVRLSKICLITDTHYGARSDNLALLDHKKKFFDSIFFPYLERHNIRVVCHLGDIVDRRKYINIYTANRMRMDFLEPLNQSGRKMHIIPGNHDVYFKNSISINAIEELTYGMGNITIHMKPTEVFFDNTQVLFLPWICEENERECLDAVSTTKAQVLFAHLELQGFEMHVGSFCEHGHDSALFKKFDLVCSGHFHHKSTYQNINYLGNPFEMTWNDYNDPKGFHTFDTETRALEFVPNPYRLFRKLQYNDEIKTFAEVLDVDFAQYANTYVKVIVRAKTNPYLYDCYIQKLEEVNPIDVKPVDDHLNVALESDTEIIGQGEGTLDILTNTVRQAGIAEEYQKPLEDLLKTLYNDASLMET